MNYWFATCPKGLESLLAKELEGLGIATVRATVAGVEFRDTLAVAYRVCLWSRLANRVLLPLSTFAVGEADDLYVGARQIDWTQQFSPGVSIAVDFSGSSPAIRHTRFGAQRVKDAIVDHFRAVHGTRPDVDTQSPDIRLNARLYRGEVTLALDFSGDSLHRRGYRTANVTAPLKENLAAALLLRAGWPDRQFTAFVDPMCGSGTLLIEALMLAADIAPGLQRARYGFTHWSGHQAQTWQLLVEEAEARKTAGLTGELPRIEGFDLAVSAVRAATENIATAGFSKHIAVSSGPLRTVHNPVSNKGQRGLLLTNPPYGERLGDEVQLRQLYGELGGALKTRFQGWRAGVFSGNEALCFELGLRSHRQYKFFNGLIPARLLLFEVYGDASEPASSLPASAATQSTELACETAPGAGAIMLANRLRKNLRTRKNWRRNQQITCYRLYDADLSEYAVAIDVYGEAVNVQEYAAPAGIDENKAAQRILDVEQAINTVLAPVPGQLFIKRRQRQRGDQQYQGGVAASGDGRFHIQESGLTFEVNLTTYLDTGLFLDHRPVRRLLAGLSAGKRFLNLFCYTGTASVYAVSGGAAKSLSIDMSNTYLAWARRNFALNNVDESRHRLRREDCLAWLAKGGDGQRYELIFLDPPTFSNSKKMTEALDIQRDHDVLIRQAMTLLTDDGQLIFSTNKRRFSMAASILTEYDAENISTQTIDLDYARRPNIHQCWLIRERRQVTHG